MSDSKKIETPLFDRINPVQCVNGKLRRLHRLVNNVYMGKFKAHGLRGSMVSILFMIGKIDGVNQKFIADRLVLDQSTMSRDLKKLKEQGLVSIRKGEDPRYSSLFLTTKGYKLVENIAPIWENLHHDLEEILGLAKIKQIDNLIAKISSSITKIKE